MAEKAKTINQMTKAELINEIKDMRSSIKSGISGWLVETKNPAYNEKTYGVQFRNGRALVMDIEGAEEKIKMMEADFGYKATYYEDLAEVPAFEQSLIDVLQK